MTKHAHSPELTVLEALRDLPVPAQDPDAAAAQRLRVLNHLEQLEPPSGAWGRKWFWGAGVGAAAAGLFVAAWYIVPLMSGRTARSTAALPDADATAEVIRTDRTAGTELRSPAGVVIAVAPATSLRFLSAEVGSERVELLEGTLRLVVPPRNWLSPFSVITPDATVEVHGTRFSVTVRRGRLQPIRTEVRVDEGKVLVSDHRTETLLTAGGYWSSGETEGTGRAPKAGSGPTIPSSAPSRAGSASLVPTSAPEGNSSPVLALSPERPPQGVQGSVLDLPSEAPTKREPTEDDSAGPQVTSPPPSVGEGPPKASGPSTLAEENRLYAAAMAAKRAGRDADVVEHLERLLVRFPKSQLAPNARHERSRAKDRLRGAGRGQPDR